MALLALTAIRLVLAGAGLGAAIALGAPRGSAVLGFALGALAGAVFVLADPRRRLSRPAQRSEDVWWRDALRGTVPSTVGLAFLSALALLFSPVLTALLAGVVAGLGVAGLTWALSVGLHSSR
jgi:hypothetical protein